MFLYDYWFLLYDGIGFFGFAFYKLPRLKGEKPSPLTKLKDDPLSTFRMLISMSVAIWVILQVFIKGSKGKIESHEYVTKSNFTFNLQDNLHMIGHL